MPEMEIVEFRMTEVVAVTATGDEFRIDPEDFRNGKVTKVTVPRPSERG